MAFKQIFIKLFYKNNNLDTIIERSLKIRELYHALERKQNGAEYTVEEDGLAYLTDAGLVGRHTMSQQRRWKKTDTGTGLKHKLGENIWRSIILADRMDVDIKNALDTFLTKTKKLLGE